MDGHVRARHRLGQRRSRGHFPTTRDEVGNWSTVNPLSGETVVLTEESPYEILGKTYLLSSDGAGMWTATYQTVPVLVDLGTTGETVTLVRAENGT